MIFIEIRERGEVIYKEEEIMSLIVDFFIVFREVEFW